ncbi:MAG: ATP synthase F1 subunit gamma [Parcubacteria group bacterium]|jgi:F-type H+-transporting ATPase subunit gamma
MASGKEIKRRIKSIQNTGKITRAMEMVSAAKMRRAISSVLAIRPYAHSAWSVLTNLARSFEKKQSGLLEVREVKSVLAIAITSNRGLCGSFNSQLTKKIKEELANPKNLKINRIGTKKIESKITDEELKIDFITIGRKGEAVVRRTEKEIVASFNDLTYLPKFEAVRAVGKVVIDDYLAKKYDKVVIFYTDYVSAIKQETKVRQILPLSKIDLEKQIAEMDILAQEYGLSKPAVEYKVEPSPEKVLDYIIPRLIEMQIYHAILESNASKESARMVAMRNATDAAKEMADGFTLAYNQIRQMKITQEIAEISAGMAALEN